MRCFFTFAFHLEQHLQKSWHHVFCFFDYLFSLTGKPVVKDDFFTFTFHFSNILSTYLPVHLITMHLHPMCNMDHSFLSVTVIFLVSFPSDSSFQAFKRGVRVFSDLRIEVKVFFPKDFFSSQNDKILLIVIAVISDYPSCFWSTMSVHPHPGFERKRRHSRHNGGGFHGEGKWHRRGENRKESSFLNRQFFAEKETEKKVMIKSIHLNSH